jgi:hypothetical protein
LIIAVVGSFVANVATLLYVGLAFAFVHKSKLGTDQAILLTGLILAIMAMVTAVPRLIGRLTPNDRSSSTPSDESPRRRLNNNRIIFWIMLAALLEITLFWVAKASGFK